MQVIRLVVFSHFQLGVLHISLRPHKYNREGGRKRINQQIWTWVSSKRKKGESVWHFSCSFPYICRLSRACILRETSTKPRGMLTRLWLCSLTAPFCWPPFPWTAISSRPSSSALLCQLVSFCLLWDLPSLLYFCSRGRSRAQALCLGFAPKQTKWFSDRCTPPTQRMAI